MSKKEKTADNKEQEAQAPPPYPYYQPPPPYYPPEEEINFLEYWNVIVEHRKIIGIITAASTMLALIVALVTTPVYRAETLLAPVSEKQSGGLAAIAGKYGGLAELAGINLGGDSNTEESIATLKSRALATSFIKKERLMPILFSSEWDAENKQWNDPEEPPTYWQAYRLFNSKIRSVNADKKSGLVKLAVEWKEPQLAAKWANKLVELVNEKLRKEAIEAAEKSIAYLEKQLATTGVVEVQQAIYRLIEAQTKNKMVASTREEYAFRVIDPAVPPEQKTKPKRKQIVILGFVLGAMAGIFAAFFRRFLQNQREKQDALDAVEK
ncbi:MAG: Wzz/FepE/Etk N-terminal domain-containing protein [Acidiferrobacterales bacterium]